MSAYIRQNGTFGNQQAGILESRLSINHGKKMTESGHVVQISENWKYSVQHNQITISV